MMGKFFSALGNAIGSFFHKLRNGINAAWYRFLDTKVMRKVSHILTYVPNLLAEAIPHKTRKLMWGVVFVVPLMVGFVYFFLLPFITSVIYSFSFVENVVGEGIVATPQGWANYLYVFTEAATAAGSFNELLVQAVLTIVSDIPVIIIFSLIVAVVLNSKFKGRALVRAIFFMPVVFNSQAIDLAMTSATALQAAMAEATTDLFQDMFNFQDFLINANIPLGGVNFLGTASSRIYDIVSYSGVQILIFLSAIQSVPKHLYEAAKMEGATQYEMFWKITFPMVSPMMLTAAVYTVVDSFLTSPLVGIIGTYNSPNKVQSAELGRLSMYGINAAMSWVYALVSVLIVALVLIILSKAVFYYDE